MTLQTVIVRFLDGSEVIFPHEGRAGDSKTVSYEGGFVIVTDERGKKTAYPSNRIKEIVVQPDQF